jgi:hypothetical protein
MHPRDTTTIMCFQCGQPGHTQNDCPKRFNIQYMDLEERQGFTQVEFVALNIMETEERADGTNEEVQEDFGPDNK